MYAMSTKSTDLLYLHPSLDSTQARGYDAPMATHIPHKAPKTGQADDPMRLLRGCSLLILALALASCSSRQAGQPAGTDDEKRARIQGLYEGYNLPLSAEAEVSPRELAALQKEGAVVVVDVREAEERSVSIIPGAISKEHYESNEEDYDGRPVVAYCTIGYRSGRYVDSLRRRGLDAKNLRGSILSWTHAGLPLVDERGEDVKRAHVYGPEWDLLPEGFEAVW